VKNLMPWIKANIPIVVLSVVILLILPAAFVGSSMWNSKIKNARQKVVTDRYTTITSAGVSYQLPPSAPGAVSAPFHWDAPNPVATAYFRENRAKIDEQVKKVTVKAEEINKSGHTPLIDGVFPTPTAREQTLNFAEALVGKGGKPSAYQLLLDKIKAGPAADPVKVAEVVSEALGQERAKIQAKENRDKFTPEEDAKIADTLTKIRVGQYMSHARDISVYATKDCFPASIVRSVPVEPPPVTACWAWQEDYWVLSDLLSTVQAANESSTGVDQSVVKRIKSILLYPLEASSSPITGRKNSSANKSYDVRDATMKVIVSSSRLPQFINAISRTDFMTVTGLEFSDIDRFADLEQGYYYGDEHIVEATINIESVWLRSWTVAYMPEETKKAREEAPAEAAPAAAPATPRQAARPTTGEDAPVVARPKGKSTKKPGSKKGGD
jgi:hypothetical protein